MSFNDEVGIDLLLREEARVDEALGGLNASKHPVDEDDEHGAENEKRHVDTKGGSRVERLERILKQHSEDSEDEDEDREVEPDSPASDDQTKIATRGRWVRSLLRSRARAVRASDGQAKVSIFSIRRG